uniref:NADH-ubiquinone oxidoreductase chain 5 n=1 Tax=Myadora brevis TaxID=457650 RepID=A0A1U9XPI4_9BIVA|nr:NADH dehydrogenase subunit 5 [Myadora brevis]AQZ26157.1 NADH dehydrogenase subunit 5 [Myadora brevis]
MGLSCSLAGWMMLSYCLALFPLYLVWNGIGMSLIMEWEVFEVSSALFVFPFIIDCASLVFSFVVCYITSMVMFYSGGYMYGDEFLSRFVWLVIFFVLSMNFLLFIPSLWGLMLGWDGLGITSFALVVYFQNPKSLSAGMITALMNRVGDMFLILAIGLFSICGHWSMLYMWGHLDCVMLVGSIFVMFAGFTKSAQMPFSSWLPAAMAAPTPVSALVHSSTLVTAGVYLLFRFFDTWSKYSDLVWILAVISICTLLMAGIGANLEIDFKKVIALSTLSQLGMMMLCLSVGLCNLAMFHLLTHAMLKALLFMCAGAIIYDGCGGQDVRFFGSVSRRLPLTIGCFNASNFALCGMPFVGAFYSKDLILELCLTNSVGWWILVLLFIATGLTVCYSIRLSYIVCWGYLSVSSLVSFCGDNYSMKFSMFGMVVGAIGCGSFLQSGIPVFEELFHMTKSIKISVVKLLMISLFFSFLFIIKGESSVVHMFKVFFRSVLSFFSSMWFLALLGGHLATNMGMNLSKSFFSYLEQGWSEICGGIGSFKVVSFFSFLNQRLQSNLITSSLGYSLWKGLSIGGILSFSFFSMMGIE